MRHGSVRLRLTRSEVARFAEEGAVEERIEFPNGAALVFSLARSRVDDRIRASMEGNHVRVSVPENPALEWARTEQVGMEQSCGGLIVLVEKDFQCAHGSADDDAFEPTVD